MGGDERFAHLSVDAADKFAIGGVAGFDGDEVTVHRPAKQRQVADNVENLVPNEFVRISQGFVGQDCVLADDDGVFETATFDEAIGYEELDFFEEAERPRVRQITLPGFGR